MRYTVPMLALVVAPCEPRADTPAFDAVSVPCPLEADEWPLPVPAGSLFTVVECWDDYCLPAYDWRISGDFLIVEQCTDANGLEGQRVEVRYIAP